MEIKDKELHRISITAIIYREDGRYLITRRSLTKKAYPGRWVVPGGGLETDDYVGTPPETTDGAWFSVIEKALQREIREEVGLEIESIEYLLNLAFVRPDGVPILILSYFAKHRSGEVVLDDDSIEYVWVTLEEAKQYDLVDGIWDQIALVDKKLKG